MDNTFLYTKEILEDNTKITVKVSLTTKAGDIIESSITKETI
jgi:hypothetical protein